MSGDGHLGGSSAPNKRHLIVILGAAMALSSADAATVGAAASQLRHAFHISNTQLGAMIAVSGAVGAIATIPAGALVDRMSRVRLLSASIGAWGAAMVASALAPSFAFLMASRVGLGLVMATAGPAIASLLGDYFEAGERSRIYGWVLSGEVIGAGAGFVLAALVASISWRACFAALAVPAAVLPWLVSRLPEPARSDDATNGDDGAPGPDRLSLGQAIMRVLSVRTNLVLIASSAIADYFFAGVRTFGVEFAKGQYGVSQSTASLLTILIGLGVLAGVIVGGHLGDRIEKPHRPAGRILVAIVGIELASFVFVPALLTDAAILSVPLLMVAGSGLGATNPPIDAARLQIMPGRLWGRSEGVRSVLKQGAQSAAPVVFGLVADSVAGGGHAGLQAAFLIMLAPLALSGIVLTIGLKTYPGDAARAGKLASRSAAAGSGHHPAS